RSFSFQKHYIIPPQCQGPIYKFLVFAFFSLLPIFPARFAPMARECVLRCGEEWVLYIYAFRMLPSQSQGACAPCARSAAGGAKCTTINHGKVCGKEKPQKRFVLPQSFSLSTGVNWALPPGELARSA